MEKELHKSFPEVLQEEFASPEIIEVFQDFQRIMMMYSCAIKEVRTKFEVLNDELSVSCNRNPIEMIKSRVKKPQSIIDKLRRNNLEISMASVMENLNDVAGIRVICSFVDDIYRVADMLTRQTDIKLIQIKDYIKNPKDNGYRSYHMIVEVPVFFSDAVRNVRVEVQLRTIAMDFWASLEHTMKYKKDIKNPGEIAKELKECAELISQADFKMQEINYNINKA